MNLSFGDITGSASDFFASIPQNDSPFVFVPSRASVSEMRATAIDEVGTELQEGLSFNKLRVWSLKLLSRPTLIIMFCLLPSVI